MRLRISQRITIIALLIIFACIIFILVILPYHKSHFSCLTSDEWKIHLFEEEDGEAGEEYVIPAILHQTWKNESIPEKWMIPYQRCRKHLEGYEFMFWTNEKSRSFIAKEYPWFLETFDSYPYDIERADAIRYFVLYHYGGFYVDLDIGCARNFNPLRKEKRKKAITDNNDESRKSSSSFNLIDSDDRAYDPIAILPKTEPIGFSNDWMASTPRHPFFGSLISALPDWNLNLITNYPTVFFSTGPMFLNTLYCLWPNKTQITVLGGKHYGGSQPGITFITHFHGSSWHSWDAKVIMFFWNNESNWKWLLIAVLFLILVIVLFVSYRKRRKRKSQSGSSSINLVSPKNVLINNKHVE